MQLFHDILHVFTGWRSHTNIVDQSTLRLKWVTSKEAEIEYITDLPSIIVVRPQNRRATVGQDKDKADLTNLSHLESLICKHPELSLFVEHDVQVNGNLKKLRYRVSLIEVACRYIYA